MKVELGLHKKYVEKTRAEANKRGAERFSGDDNPENWLLWEFDDDDPGVEIDLDNNVLRLYSYNTPIGQIYLSVDLSADIQIDLLEMFVKRMNKIKAVLEALR